VRNGRNVERVDVHEKVKILDRAPEGVHEDDQACGSEKLAEVKQTETVLKVYTATAPANRYNPPCLPDGPARCETLVVYLPLNAEILGVTI
jgi:hypothetical protein